jgi:glycosyltransferase involved in cell wall biosynthesis
MSVEYIKHKRGIAVATFNRSKFLHKVLDGIVKTQPGSCRLVVVDDGSTDDTRKVVEKFPQFVYIAGPNMGVIANKNRALFALQNCEFVSIIEDDLVPVKGGWFENYEQAALISGIHHFCRVQDREVPETVPEFAAFLGANDLTPIYGPSPRGDLTFITSKVIKQVGAFNPAFIGAGYGHGEWSERVFRAGLIPHPNRWIDIKEARDCFIQKGDKEGGRWLEDEKKIKEQLKRNGAIGKKLKREGYTHYPLILY